MVLIIFTGDNRKVGPGDDFSEVSVYNFEEFKLVHRSKIRILDRKRFAIRVFNFIFHDVLNFRIFHFGGLVTFVVNCFGCQ